MSGHNTDHDNHGDNESKWIDLEAENENASLPVGMVPYLVLGVVVLFIVCVRLYIVTAGAAHH